MMRRTQMPELLRPMVVSLATLCLSAASASAQDAVQQGVQQAMRHGAINAPMAARFDVDSAMARATMLRRQNRRPAAAAVMKQAVAAAPERADARALYDLLQHELHGGEALVGIDYKSWRTQLPEWREGGAALRQNTPLGPAIARASYVERGALQDRRVQLEAYPAFPTGYLALSGSVASGATLFAHTTASAELFKSITPRLEGSFGYRRMNFTSAVDLLTGSAGTYVGNALLGARVTHIVNDGGTSVSLSARQFLTDDGQYLGVKLTTGSLPIAITTPTDFEVRFSQSIGAEARVVVRGLLVLTADGELGREGLSGGSSSEYSAVRVGVGVRY
jgi:YaiO family outer membrane protein